LGYEYTIFENERQEGKIGLLGKWVLVGSG
jgi:hypothetical protein